MEAGRMAGGSSCVQRLDPFSLPVRFSAADEAADQRLRIVDLHRERVVFRRSVRGMRMTLNLPVKAFRGIAIRLLPDEPIKFQARSRWCSNTATPPCRCRCSPRAASDDILAEWQSWGRVLGLPLLVVEADGSLREPFARLGAVRIEPPTWRRRRRNAIARRRPFRVLRRRSGRLACDADRA